MAGRLRISVFARWVKGGLLEITMPFPFEEPWLTPSLVSITTLFSERDSAGRWKLLLEKHGINPKAR